MKLYILINIIYINNVLSWTNNIIKTGRGRDIGQSIRLSNRMVRIDPGDERGTTNSIHLLHYRDI